MDLFLGFTPKGLIPMEIFVHPYIPMILPTSSQCGTLVVYPTILPSNKGPSSLPSNDYPSVHSLPTRILRSNALEAHALHGSTTCLESLLHPRSTPLHRVFPNTSMKNPEHTACLTELIHRLTGAHHLCSAFLGFIDLGNLELGSDTTGWDFGHHISPQWYDIFHFGPKPSWVCFWALPQKASYQWRYVFILIYP